MTLEAYLPRGASMLWTHIQLRRAGAEIGSDLTIDPLAGEQSLRPLTEADVIGIYESITEFVGLRKEARSVNALQDLAYLIHERKTLAIGENQAAWLLFRQNSMSDEDVERLPVAQRRKLFATFLGEQASYLAFPTHRADAINGLAGIGYVSQRSARKLLEMQRITYASIDAAR